MSRQRPSHVVQYSRAILYEDKVIRKTAKVMSSRGRRGHAVENVLSVCYISSRLTRRLY